MKQGPTGRKTGAGTRAASDGKPMLTVIGICPLAAIRDCSDTAKTITQRHCAQEKGPLVIRPFWMGLRLCRVW